jgi:hypothetical protein
MKENLGKKEGKWPNCGDKWEIEDNEKNLRVVGTPAAR